MKIAVIKLGARISFSSQGSSGGTGEALSIIKMLEQGGADVHIFTKILDKDVLPETFKWHDMREDVSALKRAIAHVDALLIINGTVQFYGGAEDREQLLNYILINEFSGPVYYIFCDPELTLKQVWSAVEGKPWASNWSEQMLNIERTDIRYVAQPYDVQKVLAELKKNEVKPSSIVHFPLEQFPCLNDRLPFNESPTVDLSYGGTMRGGRRIAKMLKFYFGHPSDISVEMFGKIDAEDFTKHKKYGSQATILRNPTFTGPVRYDEMLPKMNKSMAHCVIGDPWYEEINDIPQRLYESIMSQVVTFADYDMDTKRRVYGADKELADFLYVKTREELSEKIQLLKSDVDTRKEIIAAQFAAVGFDTKKYCESFVNLLRN